MRKTGPNGAILASKLEKEVCGMFSACSQSLSLSLCRFIQANKEKAAQIQAMMEKGPTWLV